MNSILHNCTHKNDDVTFQLSESEMYVAIFAYIEHLFGIIKPKKLFYMAIDGVAPRAKMNQQRARRFRSALDAEVGRAKAIEQGIPLPATDPFDSNAITPGTEFMEKLTAQLKYFVHKKVSQDSSWQNIEIILSGHEVPGEGEHKIMEHIRVAKAQPGYSPDIRHCLYGLDADLIMLGLLSHDPHFALLREEVTFGRATKQSTELQDQNFYLLHLAIVREYLELEFSGIEKDMKFEYDFERILDDFILINFFIGNDFLPELPSLVINKDALPIVFNTYKSYLRKSDGYMSKGGIINFSRLKLWLEAMTQFEYKLFEETSIDSEWFSEQIEDVSQKGKAKQADKLILSPRQKELVRQVKQFVITANSASKPESDDEEGPSFTFSEPLSEDDVFFMRTLCEKVYLRVISAKNVKVLVDVDGIPDEETLDETKARLHNAQSVLKRYEKAEVFMKEDEKKHKEEIYSEKFLKWKSSYYRNKFQVKSAEESEALIRDVAENYLEGLQWVLLYYYRGVASWGWFYRYHYAPKISDIALGLDKKISFDVSTPFKPFEQLMAVLPERSKALVPRALWPLMTEDNSPIKDFYPKEFELDMNDKKNEWEAIVKIPFVDQKRLLDALKSRDSYLLPEEQRRNGFGTNIEFHFNPQVNTIYPSSYPSLFPNIENCHCIETEVFLPPLESLHYVDGLCPGAKLGVNALAGFPSLKTIPFTFKIESAEVVVFQHPSRNESIILTLKNRFEDLESSTISKRFLNRPVHVGWPYLREAKVVAITDEMCSYEMTNKNTISTIPHNNLDNWQREAGGFKRQYARKGVNIGKSPILVHVAPLQGLKRTPAGALVKFYSSEHVTFPLQTVVESVQNENERYIERPPIPIEEEFPLESKAVYLGPSAFGNPVTVKEHHGNVLDVEVMKLSRGEISVGHMIEKREKSQLHFMPSFRVAKDIRISSYYLSRVTAKYMVFINGKTYDVGLNIRSEAKKLKVLGYSQRALQGWEFSSLASSLVLSYLKAFPDIHTALMNYNQKEIPDIATLLHIGPQEAAFKMDQVRAWMKEHVHNNNSIVMVTLETEGLSRGSVLNLEREIIKINSTPIPVSIVTHKNTPREALLAPANAFYQLSSQHFSIGDRVVSVLDYGKVNLFSRGTVISINSMVSKVTLDVLFDVEFDSGTTLNGRCETKRGLTVENGSVLNLSNKQLVFHSKKSQEQTKVVSKGTRQSVPAPPSAWKKGTAPILAKPQVLQRPKAAHAPAPAHAAKGPSAPAAKGPSALKGPSAPKGPSASSAASVSATASTPTKAAKRGKTVTVSSATEAGSEEMRQNLLSLIKGVSAVSVSRSNGKKEADPLEVKSKNKKSLQQSQNNLMGAVYGQYAHPPIPDSSFPPAPPGVGPFMMAPHMAFPPQGMPFPPPFIPGMQYMPPMPMGGPVPQSTGHFDEQGSAQLMAALNGGGQQQAPSGPANQDTRGNGSRGRGGRGRGRGRGGNRGGRGGQGDQGQSRTDAPSN